MQVCQLSKVVQKVRLSFLLFLSCIVIQKLSRHLQRGDTAVIPLTQLQLPHGLDSRRPLMQPKQDEQHPTGRGETKGKPNEGDVLILPNI